jgi:hypothetical protein
MTLACRPGSWLAAGVIAMLAAGALATAAGADRPEIVQPSNGQTVDLSKVMVIGARSNPAVSERVMLQICQWGATRLGPDGPVPTEPLSETNQCGLVSGWMGGRVYMGTGTFMEQSAKDPGLYLHAIDPRCGMSSPFERSLNNRPAYLRAVNVSSSYAASNEFLNSPGNGYFNRVTLPWGTADVEDENTWGPQIRVDLTEPPSDFVKPSPGISINDGATYTNSVKVTVSVQPTPCVDPYPTSVRLSNDGGFKPNTRLALDGAESSIGEFKAQWKLVSTGTERLPKTVYASLGSGLTYGADERYTDDIILDQQDPVLESAQLAGAGAAVVSAKPKRFRVTTKAKDSNSGVGHVQVTSSKSKPGALISYRRTVTVTASSKPRWVRVGDKAGNFSRWKQLK